MGSITAISPGLTTYYLSLNICRTAMPARIFWLAYSAVADEKLMPPGRAVHVLGRERSWAAAFHNKGNHAAPLPFG